MNLTLPAAEFGPTFAGYEQAKSTAPLKTQDLMGDPCSVDLLATLQRLGFERGYNRDWVRPTGVASDRDLSVGSFVEIYPDASAAHAKVAFDKTNAVAPVPVNCNAHVLSSSTFDVSSSVGEEVFGYRKTITGAAGIANTYTWVEFRRGRVVASTDVIRDDSRDTAAEAARYAQTLDAHLVQSLSGR